MALFSMLASRREGGVKGRARRNRFVQIFCVGYLAACAFASAIFLSSIPSCQATIESGEEIHRAGVDGDTTTVSARQFPVLTINELDEGIAYLRYGDTRLVRYNVPSKEAENRQEEFCSKNLETLVLMLSTHLNTEDSTPLNVQTKVVQLLTLCSSENPDYRENIGTFGDSVALRAILSMLEEDDPLVHAVLGEAIWILSFNDEHNHNFLTDNDAIAKMVSAFVKFVKDQENDKVSGEDKAASTLAMMWIAAALQNLAASYCDTDSGHCWWEYDFEEEEESGEEGGLFLHEDSPLVIDGSKAAEFIVNSADGRFASLLQTMVCVEPMADEDEAFWPTLATVDGALRAASDPRLATWAVAGLLKNLSMYAGSKEVPMQSHECLCALMHSEDWLESSKAEDALFRLGEACGDHDDERDDEEYERDEL